jgi:hypothetical protein
LRGEYEKPRWEDEMEPESESGRQVDRLRPQKRNTGQGKC